MVLRLLPYKLSSYGLSDMGLVRTNNEDVFGRLEEHDFFVLADGMGGHQAGEVAAREAVLYLCSHIRTILDRARDNDLTIEIISLKLGEAIEDTNQFIYEMSHSHELLKGMGTTLCCLYFHDDLVLHANVGDSRVYRLREKKLQQLTQDHSLVREMLDYGVLTEPSHEEELYKNIITKAIGTEAIVEPATQVVELKPHDLFLLCSDGLSDLVPHEEIEKCLNKPHTVEEKVRSLIHAAKLKGGYDNITVVLVEVTHEHAAYTIENEDLPR